MTEDTLPSEFIIRKKSVRVDANGLVCLTDIWGLAGSPKNQRPYDWGRLPEMKKLEAALLKKVTGKSRSTEKIRSSSIHYSKPTGTYAHPVLACAYAGYLSPQLEIEIREVWLRYKQADATLADEILAKASAADNEWAGARAMGRVVRSRYANTLHEHGVSGKGFGICTNETYSALFNSTAAQLKKQRGLKKSAALRDSMSSNELAYVMAAESLSSERIEDTNSQGLTQCQISTRISATHIREAIEKDRASRKTPEL